MATTTDTNFAAVTEAFNRVYQQLREDNGENAPNSYTYFAPTMAELSGPDHAGRDLSDKEELAGFVGDPDAETVAWVYEVNGFNLFRITANASENELITLFGRCMGYDL